MLFTFLGSEYGIVLLSTVRSLQLSEGSSETADVSWIRKNLGFVADPHRICVGITRCKYGLVIVGKLTCMVYIHFIRVQYALYIYLHTCTNNLL